MILSDAGVLVKTPTTLWEGTPASFPGFSGLPLSGGQWASHAELYRNQLWVSTVINKLGMGEARLPLKVYEHDDMNRPEAREHPYSRLLRRPNHRHNRFFFWLWTCGTFDVHGESFWGKIRDGGGRPIELAPLNPTCMHPEEERDGQLHWTFQNGTVRIEGIPQSDLVHFKTFNPANMHRGLSRLEPLRRTLEFEDAAQRAQSSFWSKGARPGVLLSTEKVLSQGAIDRLKLQWNAVAGGVDNTGKTVVLEEGLKPEKWAVSNEEAQYIESRKLNREEVCAVFDVPPPAVHILDRATFSNITEQLRSLYRDTHAPRLQMFESVLEHDLRGSTRPGASEPDFGDEVYAEFLLDEVLRGDFEARSAAYSSADYMTIAEKRRSENLPYIAGTDTLLVNAANQPLDPGDELDPAALVQMLRQVYLAVDVVISAEEAREILNRAGAGLTGTPPASPAAVESLAPNLRTLMGRLARAKSLADVDAEHLVADLNGSAPMVRVLLDRSLRAGHTPAEFRQILQATAGGTP